MNYYSLFILALNILSVFCIVTESEDCKSVNTFLNEFMTTNAVTIDIPECCVYKEHGPFISCDESGSITNIKFRYTRLNKKIDFSTFPRLNNLQSFYLDGPVLKDDTFPTVFLQYPKLESLQFLNTNIRTIPDFDTCNLKILDLYNNTYEGFPKSILKCTQLTKLNVSVNENIKSIPDEIGKLNNLEILYLGETGLTSLSPEVYKLPKLNDFDLDGNQNLSTEIRFNHEVEYCNLIDTNVKCYEKGSCKNFIVQENPRKIVPESNKEYRECQSSERGISENTSSGGSKKSTYIIIGLIAAILVILALIFFIYKRNNKDEKSKDFMVLAKQQEEEQNKIEPVINVEETETNRNILPNQISEIDIKTPVSPDHEMIFPNEIPKSNDMRAMPSTQNDLLAPPVTIPLRTDSNDYVLPQNMNEIQSPVQPTIDITSAPMSSAVDYVSPVSPSVDFDTPLSPSLDINLDSHLVPPSDTSFGVSPISPIAPVAPVPPVTPEVPVVSNENQNESNNNNNSVDNNNTNIPMCYTSEPRFSSKHLEALRDSNNNNNNNESNTELPPYSGPTTNPTTYQGNTLYTSTPMPHPTINRSFNMGYGTDQNNLSYYSDNQDVNTDTNVERLSIQSSPTSTYGNMLLPMNAGINPIMLNNGYYNMNGGLIYPNTNLINNFNNGSFNTNSLLMPYNMIPMGNLNSNFNYSNINFDAINNTNVNTNANSNNNNNNNSNNNDNNNSNSNNNNNNNNE